MLHRFESFPWKCRAVMMGAALMAFFMAAPGWVKAQDAGPNQAQAAAQAPQPAPPRPIAPVAPDSSIDVATGSFSVISMDPLIEGVDIADRTVCNVRQIRKGFIVQGLRLGKTRIVLWGEDLGIKAFDVVVAPDRADVMARLLQKYPRSGLRLVPSPETGKVIIEGTLPYYSAVEDVYRQLEGPDLKRSQMLSYLYYIY